MAWAAVHGYVVITNDLDFGAILAATQARKPSVLQIRSDVLTTRRIGALVLTAIRQAKRELLEGAILSLDLDRARLRILPLSK